MGGTSSSKNFKATLQFLLLSDGFLCGESHKGKHLTAIEIKQNTTGYTPRFCCNEKILKISSRNKGKTMLFFVVDFVYRKQSLSGHIKAAYCQ